MSFLKTALDVMTDKRTITRPTFVKDFSKNNKQLAELIELIDRVPEDKKEYLERDIAFLKYGIEGEENVYYELKNSFIPMLCLHDIRLEYNGYVAQFDFIIITNKFIYVLETKMLSGDIQISDKGDFTRIIKSKSGKVIKKEGMYSPITQNERHVNILKEILVKEGLIKTLPIKSVVVIANQKTIIDMTKANKELKNNIVKYDLLNKHLKEAMEDKNNEKNILEKYMYRISDFLIENNKPAEFNYDDKYSITNKEIDDVIELSDDEIRQALKEYRLMKSKEEGLKAYMVFSNEEMELLIKERPKSKEELLMVKGFGPKKVEKYGDEIILNFKR